MDIYKKLQQDRLQEKCRRCKNYSSENNYCYAKEKKIKSNQRKEGCYQFKSDPWAGAGGLI